MALVPNYRNGSEERFLQRFHQQFHQQFQGQANSHTNHLGNKAMKDGGMIRDSFPGINSPGQAPVEHARGFTGSRTRLQWSFSGGVGLWGWCARALGPVRLSRKILGNSRARRKILGFSGNSGKSWHRSRVHQSRPENGVM